MLRVSTTFHNQRYYEGQEARGHRFERITLAVELSLMPAATLWADSPKVAAPPPPSMADVQSTYGQLPQNSDSK